MTQHSGVLLQNSVPECVTQCWLFCERSLSDSCLELERIIQLWSKDETQIIDWSECQDSRRSGVIARKFPVSLWLMLQKIFGRVSLISVELANNNSFCG